MCLNAIAIGSVNVSWHNGVSMATDTGNVLGGNDSQKRCLLQMAPPAAQAVVYRWKEIPPQKGLETGRDRSWQPAEGCVHGVRIVLDLDGWQAVGELAARSLKPAFEQIVPPQFESCWCRLAVFDVELEVPTIASSRVSSKRQSDITVAIPAALLTSLLGVGELLCALDTLPSGQTGSALPPVPAADAASASHGDAQRMGFTVQAPAETDRDQASSVSPPCLKAPSLSTSNCSVPGCACGRELARGKVRVTGTSVPVRVCPSARFGVGSQSAKGQDAHKEFVTVRHAEFMELMRAQTLAEAWTTSLPSLQQHLTGLAGLGSNGPQTGRPTPPEPRERSQGSMHHRHSQATGKSGRSSSGLGASGPEVSTTGGEAESLAERWASMQETVRRLQCELQEMETRCAALRQATASEVARAQTRASEEEGRLTAMIAAERYKQAELSAKAQEQRQTLNQLLHGMPSWSNATT